METRDCIVLVVLYFLHLKISPQDGRLMQNTQTNTIQNIPVDQRRNFRLMSVQMPPPSLGRTDKLVH